MYCKLPSQAFLYALCTVYTCRKISSCMLFCVAVSRLSQSSAQQNASVQVSWRISSLMLIAIYLCCRMCVAGCTHMMVTTG